MVDKAEIEKRFQQGLKDTGENISRFRAEQEMSVDELASSVNVAPYVIEDMEAGRINFEIDLLAEIAHALGVDAAELVRPRRPQLTVRH